MDEQSIFLTALEKGTSDERIAYLNEACGDDPALRQRVDALLTRYDDAGSFLERPPTELDATAMGVDDTREEGDPDSDVRTTLYETSDDVSLDSCIPPTSPAAWGRSGSTKCNR